MRRSLVALAFVVLIPTTAAEVDLDFREPASLQGAMEVAGAKWVALRLPPGASMTLDVLEPGRLVYTNLTTPARASIPVAGLDPIPPYRATGERRMDAMRLVIEGKSGNTTLLILVEGNISVAGRGLLHTQNDGELEAPLRDQDLASDWSGWDAGDKGVALSEPYSASALRFQGVRVHALEWFDARVTCSTDPCPSGGGWQRHRAGGQGFWLTSETAQFERFEGNGRLEADLGALPFVVAGPSLDVTVNGEAVLPVSTSLTCDTCPPIEDSTVRVRGLVRLRDIAPNESGLHATLSGDFESVRIDETWVSPAVLGGVSAAAVATVGAVILLKLVLMPLFTTLSKAKALEHPKRQQIFAYVQEHPGANFREIARNTGIAAGTVRHHLTILERSGHLVEHNHKGTVRLFENHGKFDHNWSDVVLLREPALAAVHDWLRDHPESPQKDLLEAMEAQGWSRSTTQHRLARLVAGGVVTIRLQGRLKIYSLAPRPSRPPGPVGMLPPPLATA